MEQKRRHYDLQFKLPVPKLGLQAKSTRKKTGNPEKSQLKTPE